MVAIFKLPTASIVFLWGKDVGSSTVFGGFEVAIVATSAKPSEGFSPRGKGDTTFLFVVIDTFYIS
jgi:hypothetical protein